MRSRIRLPTMDAEYVRQEIGDKVIDFCRGTRKSGLVIGLSGGVDSTVSGGIISSRFAEYNNTVAGKAHPLELVGYILPSSTNNPADAEDGIDVAKRLGIRHEVIDIEGITRAHMGTDPRIAESVYHKGNMMSRIRANILSTQGALEGKLVAGTGNKDEDFGIGYYTLFGDGAVHISPIGELSKRLVCEMADYLGFPDIAKRVPTAGLEPGQTDFGDLGYSYGFVELLSCGLEQGYSRADLVNDPVVNLVAGKDRAEYATLFGESKFSDTTSMIDDMLHRHRGAAKKVSLISPTVVPVTLQYAV
ncbi:NAD(+) synthase [archaeon]|nr:NAD(+) synthase [archaeon]MBT6762037.1 NAD(+) synthase [archaeon]